MGSETIHGQKCTAGIILLLKLRHIAFSIALKNKGLILLCSNARKTPKLTLVKPARLLVGTMMNADIWIPVVNKQKRLSVT